MSISDRLSSLSRTEMAGLAVVVVVTLAGAGLWYTRSLPKPVAVQATPAPDVTSPGAPVLGAAPSGSPASASASPVSLIIDVAGWVRKPGVYEFAEGDRVVDAIDAAGGPRPDADLASINLAAPLVDGTQILVGKEGAAPLGADGTPLPSASGATGDGTLIDVNTASATDLEELPGVGEVIAAAIVDYRTQNGPFTSVDQLEEVSGIGPATLENIRDLVTV
jgi:competence protein ComEA